MSNANLYATNAAYFKLTCGRDCTNSNIYCPESSENDGTDCIIDCSQASDSGAEQCRNLRIHAADGIPKDVKLSNYKLQFFGNFLCPCLFKTLLWLTSHFLSC